MALRNLSITADVADLDKRLTVVEEQVTREVGALQSQISTTNETLDKILNRLDQSADRLLNMLLGVSSFLVVIVIAMIFMAIFGWSPI